MSNDPKTLRPDCRHLGNPNIVVFRRIVYIIFTAFTQELVPVTVRSEEITVICILHIIYSRDSNS